ncbi:MAG: c-type cytochrome [Geminicoccaceae bacterium]
MREMLTGIVAAAVAVTMISGAAFAEGDAAAGEKVYKKCKTCHVIDEEKNKVGPHLVGIVGRTAGAADGFKYSKAMMESGITWDEATIAAYLADPKGYIKGNKMAFVGLKKEEDIANVIAYMKAAAAQ